MKKIIIYTALTLASIAFFTTKAQKQDISINFKVPIYSYYDYSWSSSTYTSQELGNTGIIKGIKLNIETNTKVKLSKQRIYIANVDNNYSITNKRPDTSSMQKVFDGTIEVNGAGELTIQFNKSFSYKGEQLMIYFENNSGTSTFPLIGFTTKQTLKPESAFNYSVFKHNDSSGNILNDKPRITFITSKN